MEDIAVARNAQAKVYSDYANEHPNLRPIIEVPKATYDQFTYSFQLRNCLNFYIEADIHGKPYGDIILNEAGTGLVRLTYDAMVHSQLSLYMSLQA